MCKQSFDRSVHVPKGQVSLTSCGNPTSFMKRQICTRLPKIQRAAFASWIGTNNQPSCPPSYKLGNCMTDHGRPTNTTCSHQHSHRFGTKQNLWSLSPRKIHTLNRRLAPCYMLTKSHHHHENKTDRIFMPPTMMQSSDGSNPLSANPLLALQPFVSQPILPENERIFTPSEADIVKACSLFEPKAKHRIRFVKGAFFPEQAPEYTLPEIAFIGRSNVGKSSLIKAMFPNVPGLDIRTSKTPGHTKILLFFQVGKAFSLVDMPGYGFNQPANFITSAEGFLKQRKNLRNTFLLIDSFTGIQAWDYVAMEMLEEFAIPYLIVLTKADKASKRQLIENVMAVSKFIRENTHGCLPQPFLVSSKTGAGLPLLKGFIAYTTDNLQLQES